MIRHTDFAEKCTRCLYGIKADEEDMFTSLNVMQGKNILLTHDRRKNHFIFILYFIKNNISFIRFFFFFFLKLILKMLNKLG